MPIDFNVMFVDEVEDLDALRYTPPISSSIKKEKHNKTNSIYDELIKNIKNTDSIEKQIKIIENFKENIEFVLLRKILEESIMINTAYKIKLHIRDYMFRNK